MRVLLAGDDVVKLSQGQDAHLHQHVTKFHVFGQLNVVGPFDVFLGHITGADGHFTKFEILLLLQFNCFKQCFAGDEVVFHKKLPEKFYGHINIPLWYWIEAEVRLSRYAG